MLSVRPVDTALAASSKAPIGLPVAKEPIAPTPFDATFRRLTLLTDVGSCPPTESHHFII